MNAMRKALFALPAFLVMHPGFATLATARDVPYVPTPEATVNKMLELAEAGPDDLLYDLGSGDGRIVITAVRDFGVPRAIGIDIDPERIAESLRNAEEAGVTDRTEFREENVFETDFSEASVVTMYLLSTVNLKLRPRILSELKPGTRVVSHAFDMDEWQPDRTARVPEENDNLFMWIVPAQAAGTWQWSAGERSFETEIMQSFQNLEAKVPEGEPMTIDRIALSGASLSFEGSFRRDGSTVPLRFDGEVSGDRIEGTMSVDGREMKASAERTARHTRRESAPGEARRADPS
ncbi:MAG: class I SAM-dependent methyltransferase [Acetobacterales bacterium]